MQSARKAVGMTPVARQRNLAYGIGFPTFTLQEPPSTVIWQRKGPGWSIDVHKSNGSDTDEPFWVFLTGRFEGLWRSRHMSPAVFVEVTHGVWRMQRHLEGQRYRLGSDPLGVPKLPKCRRLAHTNCGPCRIDLVVHRNNDDSLTVTLAAYDSDDDAAPVILAMGEDIRRLANDLDEACLAMEDAQHSKSPAPES